MLASDVDSSSQSTYSFLLYLYIFWSFMIYPHNLRLATVRASTI